MSTDANMSRCPKCQAPVPADAPGGLCPKCVFAGAAAGTETGLAATATSEIPSLERVAAAFPQLQILELIGRGGMGFVFKARQPHLDRFVALKLLPDKLAKDPRFAERFNREGRVLARLNHPNIVTVYDFGNTEHFYFLLMEFVDGVNLRQAMQAGRFSPAEALAIVPKVCEALQYAHEQGVLHRDIKPENILLDTKGRVKIADFGIAKLVGEEPPQITLTGTGMALGTPHYMAPEQLEKPSAVDHRADIYSLGVVFYEMLTGELPIGRFAPPSSKTPVDPRVDEVVFRTLEKEPAKRFQSAGEVQTQVQTLAEEAGPSAPRPEISPEAPAGRGPHGTIVLKNPWSGAALWGAALTGLSLAAPLLMLAGLFSRKGGIGPVELWLALACGLLPGVAGTISGWVALSNIREAQGRIRGLPLALFAALAWPLLSLAGIAAGIPWFTLTSPGDDNPALLVRLFPILLPAGALTFALWAVHAASRWGSGQPPAQRRGVLKWVFAALMLAGLALALLPKGKREGRTVATPRPSPVRDSTRAVFPGTEPLRIKFKVPKGQVALFELCRHAGFNQHEPLPFMKGYVVAPDDESAPGEVVLEPDAPGKGNLAGLRWMMNIMSEDGPKVGVGAETFGPLRLLPGVRMPLRVPLPSPPHHSLEMPLTHVNPDNPTDIEHPVQPGLALCVSFLERPRNLPAPGQVLIGSGTNWEGGLRLTGAMEARKPADARAEAGRIRFTIVAVELREDGGDRWLALDYVTNVEGDCDKVFRVETLGFEATTRKTEFLVDNPGFAPVHHQRMEWKLPAQLRREEALEVRDELAKALIAESIEVRLGEEKPLFRFPVGNLGTLAAFCGAERRKISP